MTLGWWWIGVLLTVLPQTCIMYYVYWQPLKQRPVQCVWSKDGARKAYQRRCDTIQRLQMCFCMWRILFYAPIHRVGVYSVCVYVAASVCRTWHAYRTAVWSLEYDKQNHRNPSTALLDIYRCHFGQWQTQLHIVYCIPSIFISLTGVIEKFTPVGEVLTTLPTEFLL